MRVPAVSPPPPPELPVSGVALAEAPEEVAEVVDLEVLGVLVACGGGCPEAVDVMSMV